MIIYSGSELKEHIAELKKEAMAQTGLDKVYERDFVDSIRKYCFGGKSPFVYVVCGFRATGKLLDCFKPSRVLVIQYTFKRSVMSLKWGKII